MLRTRMPWRSLATLLLTSAIAIGASGCVLVPVGGYGGAGYGVVAPLPLPVIVAPPVVYGYRSYGYGYRSYGYGRWR
jgi:hypothetical protein